MLSSAWRIDVNTNVIAIHQRHCSGLYQYSPEAFAPGAELELRVYFQDAPATARVIHT